MSARETPTALLHDAATGGWLAFGPPVTWLTAWRLADVRPVLDAVEQAVAAHRLYAVGLVTYEAAPAFDPALAVVRPDPAFPLLAFGLFHPPRPATLSAFPASGPFDPLWTPSCSPTQYREAFDHIKRHIHEGTVYQVNLTHRLRTTFAPDPFSAFVRLATAQRGAYSAYLSLPRWTVCSASPECFFSLDGTHIESRPMKGTAPRGLTTEADRANAAALQASEKDRAEHVMITDMARNDLGRIAKPGSVKVPSLFSIEKYPTVWQMTSTVQAQTHASIAETFQALFPAASITGAPKTSAMRLIAELENAPRHAYTGAIGFLAPGRRAQFNVAIRTLVTDTETRTAEYGTGGGIVWDSDCRAEQIECQTKARILCAPVEPFSLLETLRWTPNEGFYLLDEHLARLTASADYFAFPANKAVLRTRLAQTAESLAPQAHRIRLLVAQDGTITVEAAPFALPAPDGPPLRIALASKPIARGDAFLYHKTTRRRLYNDALAAHPDCDDVLLYNAEGELTESTRANVIVEWDGTRCTPPVRCGLLPGTLRQHLLDTGAVRERVITLDDLERRPRLWLANSLRGIQPAQIEPAPSFRFSVAGRPAGLL